MAAPAGTQFLPLLTAVVTVVAVGANVPLFDVATSVRVLMVPQDAPVGSAIYRLRGTDADFDYPLRFEVAGSLSKPVVSVESYPCTRNHTFCEGSVVLLQRLEAGRVYDVKFKVVDATGDFTTLDCTLRASNGTTPTDTIFPHLPQLITVPEDAVVGSELDYVIARRNPLNARHPSLEIQGAPEFAIHQSLASNDTVNGTIILASALDFEKKSMYILQIFAVEPYAEPGEDTRNVASLKVAVAVLDVQDMPPVFTSAPAVTLLNRSVHQGDVVLSVHAEDGDKQEPRQLRYGLVSESSPFAGFFGVDERTGDVRLSRPLRELAAVTHLHRPVLLTVTAEEVRTGLHQPPAMSAAVQIALLIGEEANSPPYFENDNYVARIEENSPQGTALVFGDPYITQIRDDDMGKSGVFSITLEGNNGTFEVSPTVAEQRATFLVRVRSSKLLDFEARTTLHFTIVAREVGPGGSLSSSARVTVYIEDVNDNPPVFARASYEATLAENVTAGTTVAQVHADDADTGLFGAVQYTQILGHLNGSLSLDSITGLITVSKNNHKFDREAAAEFRFRVEARDMDGAGNRKLVPLVIKLLDANDETPRFEKDLYEFYLTPSQKNFTTPAFVTAIDLDAEAPNNVVRYEIISGNYANKFRLDEEKGELTVRYPPISSRRFSRLKRDTEDDGTLSAIVMTARAYDLGVPHRWSTTTVHVLPPSVNAHTIQFIVNGSQPDPQRTLAILRALTGGDVRINSIRPYSPRRLELSEMFDRQQAPDRSIVEATVLYDGKATVDISELQRLLQNNVTAMSTMQPVVKQAEDRALFWILMILAALIVITIILLLLCCVCPFCPLYAIPKKDSRVSTAEEVHVLVNGQGRGMETKGVQADWTAMRREAWSGDQKATEQWHFNRRNQPHRETEAVGAGVLDDRRGAQEATAAAAAAAAGGPAVVYTRELQQLQQSYDQRRDVYLEDLDGGECPIGQLLDVRHARARDHEMDTDSMRRHEVERGSDAGRGADDHPQYRIVLQRTVRDSPGEVGGREISPESRREQFYIREGNAEILRLVTRGRSVEENPHGTQQDQRPATLVPPARQHGVREEHGKDILMQRFMEDQRNSASGGRQPREPQEAAQDGEALDARQQGMLVRRLLEEEETRLGNVRLLNEALVRHQGAMLLVPGGDHETQSLPGQTSMATQTDVDSSTQTDPLCLMRPPRRRTKSDNDESYTDEDDQQTGPIGTLDVDEADDSWRKRRKVRKRHLLRYRGEIKLKRGVSTKKRKIKTPIIEETESALEAVEQHSSKSKESDGNTELHNDAKSSSLHRSNNASIVTTTAGEIEVTEVNKKDIVEAIHSDGRGKEDMTSDSLEEETVRDNDDDKNSTLKVPKEEYLKNDYQKITNTKMDESHLNSTIKGEETSHFIRQEVISETQHMHPVIIQSQAPHDQNLLKELPSSTNMEPVNQSVEYQHNFDSRLAHDNNYVLRDNNLRDNRSYADEYVRPTSRDINMMYETNQYHQQDNHRSYSRDRRQVVPQYERRSRSRGRYVPDDMFRQEMNSPSREKYSRIRPRSIDNRYRSNRWYDDDYGDGRRHYETDREEWLSSYSFDNERSRGRHRGRDREYATVPRYRRYSGRSRSRERRRSPSHERDYYEWLYHRSRSNNRRAGKHSPRSRSQYREESPRLYLSHYRRSGSRRDLEDDAGLYYDTDSRFPDSLTRHTSKAREITETTGSLDPADDSYKDNDLQLVGGEAGKPVGGFKIADGKREENQSVEAATVRKKATENSVPKGKIDYVDEVHISAEKRPRNLDSQQDGSGNKMPETEMVSKQVSPRHNQLEEEQHTSLPCPEEGSSERPREVKHVDQPETNSSVKKADQVAGSPKKDRSRQRFVADVTKDEKTQARKSVLDPRRGPKTNQQAAGRAKSSHQMGPQAEEQDQARLPTKKGSRYMEWYKTKKEEREKKKREEEDNRKEEDEKKKGKLQRTRRNFFASSGKAGKAEETSISDEIRPEVGAEEETEAMEREEPEDESIEEEKVAELHTLKVSGGFEDDLDSGIAMSSVPLGGTGRRKKHQQLMEKKSIFTIAYDDMQTQQIRADSTSPPY